MDVRVERPVGLDLGHAFARERTGERRARHPDALEHLRLLVVLGCVESAIEVVEHRQQLRDEPLGGSRGEGLLVAQRALAVVGELRGDALEVGDRLVALGLEPGGPLVVARGRTLLGCARSLVGAPSR